MRRVLDERFMVSCMRRGDVMVWKIVIASTYGVPGVDECGLASEHRVLVQGEGLTLREWEQRDVAEMVAMFDTREMDRWTPLAHPFDETVATAYIERARDGSSAKSRQFAITEDGLQPLGEVLLFAADVADTCEFAYAVGAEHRGRDLAGRAMKALFPLARADGYRTARLRIAVGNEASQKSAVSAEFELTDDPLLRRERKGYVLEMATWARDIA